MDMEDWGGGFARDHGNEQNDGNRNVRQKNNKQDSTYLGWPGRLKARGPDKTEEMDSQTSGEGKMRGVQVV